MRMSGACVARAFVYATERQLSEKKSKNEKKRMCLIRKILLQNLTVGVVPATHLAAPPNKYGLAVANGLVFCVAIGLGL